MRRYEIGTGEMGGDGGTGWEENGTGRGEVGPDGTEWSRRGAVLRQGREVWELRESQRIVRRGRTTGRREGLGEGKAGSLHYPDRLPVC